MHVLRSVPWARGWPAAILAVGLVLLTAPAARSATHQPRLIASAGWHGREIRAPRHDAVSERATWPRGWAAGAIRRGTGYAHPGGSRRVKQIQRLLRHFGYRPGPVDGLFGPRTEAAVGWFQVKHGLPVTGVVNAPTLALMRERRSRPQLTAQDLERPATGAPATVPATTTTTQPGGTSLDLTPVAIVGLLLLGLAGVLVGRRRPHAEPAAAAAPAAARPGIAPVPYELWAEGRSPGRGEFRGPVQALAVSPPTEERRPAETRYLVRDSETEEASWVRLQDIGRFAPGVPSESTAGAGTRVLGYVTRGPDESSADDAARAIGQLCEQRRWPLEKVLHDAEPTSGRIADRPGLAYALERIGAGQASGLVVARLQDLTTTARDLGPFLRWLDEAQAFLVALDVELDTSSPSGRLAARVLAEVSGWERDRIADRTRRGLEAARAQRGAAGRSAVRDDPELTARIQEMRARGMSLQAIADQLNREGVPTRRGGAKWRPSSVQATVGYKRPAARQGLPSIQKEEQ